MSIFDVNNEEYRELHIGSEVGIHTNVVDIKGNEIRIQHQKDNQLIGLVEDKTSIIDIGKIPDNIKKIYSDENIYLTLKHGSVFDREIFISTPLRLIVTGSDEYYYRYRIRKLKNINIECTQFVANCEEFENVHIKFNYDTIPQTGIFYSETSITKPLIFNNCTMEKLRCFCGGDLYLKKIMDLIHKSYNSYNISINICKELGLPYWKDIEKIECYNKDCRVFLDKKESNNPSEITCVEKYNFQIGKTNWYAGSRIHESF